MHDCNKAQGAGSDRKPALDRVERADFSLALQLLKQGARMARAGWNGRGMFIELQTPTELSKMTLPYLFMRTVDGDLVPWLASQTDLLATDWMTVTVGQVLEYGYRTVQNGLHPGGIHPLPGAELERTARGVQRDGSDDRVTEWRAENAVSRGPTSTDQVNRTSRL
jgi:hypothetical protein